MDALHLHNLRKTYPNGLQALNGIDLRVKQGDFFALLGPNGAGKSTTIGIITSLITKSSGEVHIFGIDIDQNFAKAKSFIGLVPQEYNFNIFEKNIHILVNQAGYYGIPRPVAYQRAEKYFHQLGLWDYRNMPSRELSGGLKRRLMIARALIHEPKLLILDEPTAGVDIEVRRLVWDFIREINQQGTTIILTTHYLEEAESLCNNIAIIDRGEIIRNSTMVQLLQQLHTAIFILDLEQPLKSTPDLAPFNFNVLDNYHIELEVKQQQNLNDAFTLLSAQHITIRSMRNKANRLEELFLDIINKDENEHVT